MFKIKAALFFVALGMVACGSGNHDTTTIYFVRHAEKDLSDTSDNPPLTAEGERRAERLIDVIGETPVDAIYSTEFQRNMNTVRPLAEKKNIPVMNYPWKEWQGMMEEIKKSLGKNFVVCGHGDNLIPMMDYLGAHPPIDSLGKHEYDKIFKVVLKVDTTTVQVITY